MFRPLFALFLSFWLVNAAAQELSLVPPLGPHKVGLHVRQQYDQTRVYRRVRDNFTAQMTDTERARPVQSLVWYPAAGRGEPLRYRELVHVRLCTAEEQAGPGAGECPTCKRMTLHQYTGDPTCGCKRAVANGGGSHV